MLSVQYSRTFHEKILFLAFFFVLLWLENLYWSFFYRRFIFNWMHRSVGFLAWVLGGKIYSSSPKQNLASLTSIEWLLRRDKEAQLNSYSFVKGIFLKGIILKGIFLEVVLPDKDLLKVDNEDGKRLCNILA